jgi:hypothetical protein
MPPFRAGRKAMPFARMKCRIPELIGPVVLMIFTTELKVPVDPEFAVGSRMGNSIPEVDRILRLPLPAARMTRSPSWWRMEPSLVAARKRGHPLPGTLARFQASGAPVTYAKIAAAANVSRAWLYTQPDIRAVIDRMRDLNNRDAGRVACGRHPNRSSRARGRGDLGKRCAAHQQLPLGSVL